MANVTWLILGMKEWVTWYEETYGGYQKRIMSKKGLNEFLRSRRGMAGTLYVETFPEFVGRIPPVQEMMIQSTPTESLSEFFGMWQDVIHELQNIGDRT